MLLLLAITIPLGPAPCLPVPEDDPFTSPPDNFMKIILRASDICSEVLS